MPKVKSALQETEKLRELILYIAEKSESDPAFGLTKLNKLLFFSDFEAYLRFGVSITGQEYQKLPQGPAPRQILPLMEEMQPEELAIAPGNRFGHTQKRPLALREANATQFTGAEIEIVEDVIRRFWTLNASQISDVSHSFIGWEAVGEKETIPYHSMLLDHRELTEQERA